MPAANALEKEMEFLAAVEGGEVVSQQTLSRRVGVSVGLVNALLKRAIRKGYVKTTSAPAKRWAYYLTPNGAYQKGRLVAEYLESSLDFFRHARGELEVIFARAKLRGQTRIILAGSGDLAEIAVLAAHGSGVDLIGLLAPHSNLESQQGLRVLQSLDDLGEFDLVVITEMRTPQQTYDDLRLHIRGEIIAAPALLRITTEPCKFFQMAGAGKA